MSEGLHIEITLPGPVQDVWPSFREPALVRRWFGWEHDDLDAEIATVFGDGAVVADDGRTLHIGGHRFTFEALGAQTLVRVTRAAPVGDEALDWEAVYDDVDEGWLSFLQQLRFAMTYDVGDAGGRPRHTIHLDGTTASPTTAPAALRLDVDGVAGDRYRVDVAGEELSGEVWFRSPHQLGLTVDRWGPGLLVLADAPNGGGRAASATLTTYGPIDGDRAARWTSAWRAAYPG